jgi:hypothetical protein
MYELDLWIRFLSNSDTPPICMLYSRCTVTPTNGMCGAPSFSNHLKSIFHPSLLLSKALSLYARKLVSSYFEPGMQGFRLRNWRLRQSPAAARMRAESHIEAQRFESQLLKSKAAEQNFKNFSYLKQDTLWPML